MENLINQLIDVDKQARRRVAAAKKERAGVVASLDDKKQQRLAENEAQFNAFVAEETARCDAAVAEEKVRLAALQQQRLSQMDAVARENHDRWVEMVVEGVLSAGTEPRA